MVQNKIVRLVNTCLAMWALSPASGWALGVGSLKLDSYLNEPLNAKIELLEATNLSPQEIVVNLAPAEAFEQAGIDRGFTVSQLKFKVQSDAAGKKYIVVLSDNPIREPYVNFLVEVLWPQGRLVREYTVLLDPAEYRDGLPAAVNVPTPTTAEKPTTNSTNNSDVEAAEKAIFSSKQMPITESKKNEVKVSEPKLMSPTPSPAPVAETPVSKTPSATPQSRASTQTPITQSSQSGSMDSYVVEKNDNLWEIASNLNPSSEFSVHQVMLAIQNVNPDAFIQENINLVKAGAVLRAPTAEQVSAVSRSEAINKVALQNEVWRARLAGRLAQQSTESNSEEASSKRIDGTDRDLQPEDVKEPTADAKLTLLAPSQEPASNPTTAQTSEESTPNNTDTSAESNKTTDASAEAFKIEELEGIRAENQDLQAQVSELTEQLVTSGELLQVKDEQLAMIQMRIEELGGTVPQENTDATNPDQTATSEAGAEVPVDEQNANAEPEATAVPLDMATMQEEQAPTDDSSLMSLLTQPYVIIGLGAFAALILLAVVLKKRKRNAEQLADDEYFEQDLNYQDVGTDDLFASTNPEALKNINDSSADGIVDIDAVLSEADIFMAYGRFPQALDVLNDALKKVPNDSELHMKRLEVLVESKDTKGFQAVEGQARAVLDHEDRRRLDQLRAQLGLDSPFGNSDSKTASTPEFDEEATQIIDSDLLADLGSDRKGMDQKKVNSTLSKFESSSRSDRESISSRDEEATTVETPDFDLDLQLDSMLDDEFKPMMPEKPASTKAAVKPAKAETKVEPTKSSPSKTLDLEEDDFSTPITSPKKEAPVSDSQARAVSNDLDSLFESDDSLLDGMDEADTKLDLARAYIDMGDHEGAKDILDEIMQEGNVDQQSEAKKLLTAIG